jgi:hypothetical protein
LRGKPPLREVSLPDADVQRLLSLFHRNGKLHTMFRRYLDAKDALKERGASIGLTDTPGAKRLCARLEVPTKNHTIEEGIYTLVKGMGFDLTLKSILVKGGEKHSYAITESSSHDVSRIVGIAEALVRLADMLKTPENQTLLAKPPPPPYVPPKKQEPEPPPQVPLEEQKPESPAEVVALRIAS